MAAQPTASEWLEIESVAAELAAWAGATIRQGLGHVPMEAKNGNPADPVTEIDRAVEAHVRARLGAVFPEHAVVGEEAGGRSQADGLNWHVDPVDGTANFAHKLPWCAFSLGLALGEEPIFGLIEAPFLGWRVQGRPGQGTRSNDLAVRVADPPMAGSLCLLELEGAGAWPGMWALADRLAAEGVTVRVMGSAALALASVATGGAAAALLGRTHSWDVTAGIAQVRAAGGEVTGPGGHSSPMPLDGVWAASPGWISRLRHLCGGL